MDSPKDDGGEIRRYVALVNKSPTVRDPRIVPHGEWFRFRYKGETGRLIKFGVFYHDFTVFNIIVLVKKADTKMRLQAVVRDHRAERR